MRIPGFQTYLGSKVLISLFALPTILLAQEQLLEVSPDGYYDCNADCLQTISDQGLLGSRFTIQKLGNRFGGYYENEGTFYCFGGTIAGNLLSKNLPDDRDYIPELIDVSGYPLQYSESFVAQFEGGEELFAQCLQETGFEKEETSN